MRGSRLHCSFETPRAGRVSGLGEVNREDLFLALETRDRRWEAMIVEALVRTVL